MISRHTVRCPGCDQPITLRLSVGASELQPFYYVCGKCNAATRGRLVAKAPDLKLELEAGEQVEGFHETEQVVTIDANIPTRFDTKNMGDPGGSPFIYLSMILGPEGAGAINDRKTQFRQLVNDDWVDLKRLLRYYVDRNWTMFDKGLTKFLPENCVSRPWHRHDVIHKLLDIFTAPIWARDIYPRMKEEWNSIFVPIGPHAERVILLSQNFSIDPEIIELQEHLFDCFATYVDEHDAILPGFVAESLPEPLDQYGDLRVLRDDFPALRDINIQVFEACNKALPVLVEMINMAKRGEFDLYLHPPDIRRTPRTRAQFHKLTSNDKAKYLSELQVWSTGWGFCLDRHLRNRIGHRQVRHDLPTGTLLGTSDAPIAYTIFLAKTHRLLYPILTVLNAIKIPLVYADMAAGSEKVET